MLRLKSLIAALAVIASLSVAGAPGFAQTALSEVKLVAFIEAAVAVNRLREHWGGRIEAAKDEAEAQSLMGEANAQMQQAVERADGITMEEYMQIVEAAERDPALAQQLTELFNQKTGN